MNLAAVPMGRIMKFSLLLWVLWPFRPPVLSKAFPEESPGQFRLQRQAGGIQCSYCRGRARKVPILLVLSHRFDREESGREQLLALFPVR